MEKRPDMSCPDQLMQMTPQAEEYLEAMCRLQDRGDLATPTELARELSIAPPSVLGMLRRLEEQGLLTYERKTGAVLTKQGQACAQTLRRRHRLAELLLTNLLGMPWSRAHDVACRFEHVIDDEVESYLLAALGHPTTCPHGNPLFGESPSHWRALSLLLPGQVAVVRRIMDESEPVLEYLSELNLRPGTPAVVREFAPFDGPLTIEVDGERRGMARALAAHILVEVEGDGDRRRD